MSFDDAAAARPSGFSPSLLLLLILFAASGCAALIYEIVWYQLLQIAIGSTAISLGILLATFMAGLCIGSLALPRFAPEQFHPLRIYAAIEFAISALGLLELILIPSAGALYLAGPQFGFAGMLLRAVLCAACLLPPTVLMGASLPALVRFVAAGSGGPSRWGYLYGANTMGAVFGCLAAGFYLLRVYDVDVASYAAVALNALVAFASLAMAARTSQRVSSGDRIHQFVPHGDRGSGSGLSVYAAIALSGASALGGEVVWTRLMGLMLGATVYAFSIILAVFLAGLAIGTTAASRWVGRVDPRLALGWCQMLAAAGIAWTAYSIADALPYWPIDPALSVDPIFTFQIDLVRSIWAILPPTLFWGASFPFAFAALARRDSDPGATVAGIYAANTAGAIAGGLAASLLAIPLIGTQDSERVLLGLSAAAGLIVLIPAMRAARSRAWGLAAGAAAALIALAVWGVDKIPGELIAYGRRMAATQNMSEILYTAEGRNTSIAISRWPDGAVQFHVAGKVEASTETYDMRLERMLGHLPALIHGNPHSVLVVGFGGGITAGAFTTYPGIKRIVICELEPMIPPVSTRYFAKENYRVMNDRRTQIVYDDARHFVAATPEKFDIITSDPIHPFVKGSATLYSREYFDLVKRHLNPGGVVTQWVPLYDSDAATVKSEIATFFAVFPYATVWANNLNGHGYDLVLVGQLQPPRFDLDKIVTQLDGAGYKAVAQSLADVGAESAIDLLSTYTADKADLAPWLKNAAINRDRDLKLQYLAGLALNHADADEIYRQIMQYWQAPAGIFAGSREHLDALFSAFGEDAKQRPSSASSAAN